MSFRFLKNFYLSGFFFLGAAFFTAFSSRGEEWSGLEKKRLFFGHTEFSDFLDATLILSASVDVAYHEGRASLTQNHLYVFKERIKELPRLAKMKLGFNEIFFLPAMILFFDLGEMNEANKLLLLTYDDPKMLHGVFLLHGFLASTIFNDLPLAAKAYRRMQQVPNTPEWIDEFAQRFEKGINPVTASPKVREAMCKALKNGFPISALVMAKKNKICPEE